MNTNVHNVTTVFIFDQSALVVECFVVNSSAKNIEYSNLFLGLGRISGDSGCFADIRQLCTVHKNYQTKNRNCC